MKCSWVENMISIETDGWSRPCCGEPSVNARISHISDGIKNSFNHPVLLKLKKDLETGFNEDTRNFCRRCEILENKNLPSLRTNTPFYSQDRELKLIQFKLSNKCQLTCAHCGPELSSGWAKLLNITPHVVEAFKLTDEFLEELAELLPQLSVIKFTGGEPFLDPTHWKILEYLQKYKRDNCEIQYITNGISPYRPHLWEGWKKVSFTVSADGFEESYNWFRRGSDWNLLTESVDKLSSYGRVSISYSVTPYTFQDYTKAVKFWKYRVNPLSIVIPEHASLKHFPLHLIQQLDNYKDIPFIEMANGTDVEIYKTWAQDWDKKWNTEGWAEKIFYWWPK
jgi:sulfatase maturation enzyme AslB (radical SAM superfamily)